MRRFKMWIININYKQITKKKKKLWLVWIFKVYLYFLMFAIAEDTNS